MVNFSNKDNDFREFREIGCNGAVGDVDREGGLRRIRDKLPRGYI